MNSSSPPSVAVGLLTKNVGSATVGYAVGVSLSVIVPDADPTPIAAPDAVCNSTVSVLSCSSMLSSQVRMLTVWKREAPAAHVKVALLGST